MRLYSGVRETRLDRAAFLPKRCVSRVDLLQKSSHPPYCCDQRLAGCSSTSAGCARLVLSCRAPPGLDSCGSVPQIHGTTYAELERLTAPQH